MVFEHFVKLALKGYASDIKWNLSGNLDKLKGIVENGLKTTGKFLRTLINKSLRDVVEKYFP